ncbi:unnamed protein product [Didymodactylos carnosus]|uniref:Uncharacterized protein n=1 Tax=Didymodactylos carnosus TaxID=1234261 RepID=A0A815TIP1_9BILA|nr:unnamed protein product [Didymodactylos carnosus]CAF1505733.1 unnamed protein product [Didymodactylos carnosus]CAF4180031.1 unnamed protein product [Didymodactylos carnosus]CAF4366952.1 unnamed protein product [Didymodactylos carnosus]
MANDLIHKSLILIWIVITIILPLRILLAITFSDLFLITILVISFVFQISLLVSLFKRKEKLLYQISMIGLTFVLLLFLIYAAIGSYILSKKMRIDYLNYLYNGADPGKVTYIELFIDKSQCCPYDWEYQKYIQSGQRTFVNGYEDFHHCRRRTQDTMNCSDFFQMTNIIINIICPWFIVIVRTLCTIMIWSYYFIFYYQSERTLAGVGIIDQKLLGQSQKRRINSQLLDQVIHHIKQKFHGQ